jgi:hypothetical protein
MFQICASIAALFRNNQSVYFLTWMRWICTSSVKMQKCSGKYVLWQQARGIVVDRWKGSDQWSPRSHGTPQDSPDQIETSPWRLYYTWYTYSVGEATFTRPRSYFNFNDEPQLSLLRLPSSPGLARRALAVADAVRRTCAGRASGVGAPAWNAPGLASLPWRVGALEGLAIARRITRAP